MFDDNECPDCEEMWKALTEMKAEYEKAIELLGQNGLELQQENGKLRGENNVLRAELKEQQELLLHYRSFSN